MRLKAVQKHLEGEEEFLANYSDGLTDLPLPRATRTLSPAGQDRQLRVCAAEPELSPGVAGSGQRQPGVDIHAIDNGSVRINGGYFIFKKEIFDYMRDKEELVIEPFHRLLKEKQLIGYAAGVATYFLYVMIKRADQEPVAGGSGRANGVRVDGRAGARHLRRPEDHGRHHLGADHRRISGNWHRTAVLGDRQRGPGHRAGHLLRWLADHADHGQGHRRRQAPQGFAAETTSAAAILASSHMGFGLSTTQVCSGSIIGSGVGKKLAHVRWGTARKILYGWLLTLPAAALVGGAAVPVRWSTDHSSIDAWPFDSTKRSRPDRSDIADRSANRYQSI